MRVAGALTLVASAIIAAIFFLLPTSVSFLGVSGSCGAPVIAVLREEADDFGLTEQCRQQSVPRLVIGGAVLAIGGTAGLIMTLVPTKPRQPPGPWHPQYGPPR